MEGDVLFINQEVKETAKCVLEHVLEKDYTVADKNKIFEDACNKILQDNKTLIIAISGESGTGKSVISHEMSAIFRKYGVYAKCLCTDNFYKVHPKKRDSWRKEHKDEIGITEYDWELINKITRDFRQREVSTFQVIDLNTQEVEFLTTDFSKVNVIILEGLFAIADKLQDCDYRIFLTAPQQRIKSAQEDRGKEDASDPFRDFVMAKEKNDVKNLLLGLKDVLFLNAVDNKRTLEWKKAEEIFNIL